MAEPPENGVRMVVFLNEVDFNKVIIEFKKLRLVF